MTSSLGVDIGAFGALALLDATGDLIDVTDMPKYLVPARSSPSFLDHPQVFPELKGHALARGYRPAWAANKFLQRFDVCPNHPLVRNVEPTAPNLKTKDWIVPRQIAFERGGAHG